MLNIVHHHIYSCLLSCSFLFFITFLLVNRANSLSYFNSFSYVQLSQFFNTSDAVRNFLEAHQSSTAHTYISSIYALLLTKQNGGEQSQQLALGRQKLYGMGQKVLG